MDNATPSYNFTSSLLLIRLHYYYGNEKYREIKQHPWIKLEYISTNILMHILRLSLLTIICQRVLMKLPCQLSIRDNSLLKVIRDKYLPCKIIAETSSGLDIPLLKDKGPLEGKSTAYICKNYSCKEPITDDKTLKPTKINFRH